MTNDSLQEEDQSNEARPKAAKSGAKKSFVLRMDEHTYKALERWAADEFRSVNGQMEWIIDQALRAAGRSKASSRHSE